MNIRDSTGWNGAAGTDNKPERRTGLQGAPQVSTTRPMSLELRNIEAAPPEKVRPVDR
jgi:hypothetical protein